MKETVFALLLWISQHSAFAPVPDAPAVIQVDADTLVTLFFRHGVPASLSAVDRTDLKASLIAVYRDDSRTIYVSERVDLASAAGQAVLVHELVHFLQYEQGMEHTVPCTQALERDAYTIQAAYMSAHGLKPEFDNFTVAVRSMCPSY